MLYKTTNNKLNRDKLGIIFILIVPTIVWFSISDFNLTVFLTAIGIETIIVLGLVAWYRNSAFDLVFSDDKVIYKKKIQKEESQFDYNDLVEVHFNESISIKYPSSNIFCFSVNNSNIKLTTDIVKNGEGFIEFIKFLKSKNSHFKTYVKPKGTKMHSRLRQEILGTEY